MNNRWVGCWGGAAGLVVAAACWYALRGGRQHRTVPVSAVSRAVAPATPRRPTIPATSAPPRSPLPPPPQPLGPTPQVVRRIFAIPLQDHLSTLTAPAVDQRGRVFVGESYESWLQPGELGRQAQNGTYLARVLRLGADAADTQAFGKERISGGTGYSSYIGAVAVDNARSEVYAVSSADNRLLIFSLDGAYRRTIPLPKGASHPAGYRVATPNNLTVAADGRVLYADSDQNALRVYDGRQRSWSTCNAPGAGHAEFDRPAVVSARKEGGFYVAEAGRRRVLLLNHRLEYRSQLRHWHPGDFSEQTPVDVAPAPGGGCVVAYPECLVRFDERGRVVWHWNARAAGLRFGGWNGNGDDRDCGLAVLPDGSVYLVYRTISPDDPNLVRSEILVLRQHAPVPKPDLHVVSTETFGAAGCGQFNHPCGVAVDTAGNCYVTDFNNHRVQKFTPRGRFLLRFGIRRTQSWADYLAAPAPDGSMRWPLGIAVDDARHRVYVADWGGQRIDVFTPNGEWVRVLTSGFRPWGLAVAKNGTIYASEPEGHRVWRFSPEGNVLGAWDVGGRPGMLSAAGDRLYVADRDGGVIVVLDANTGSVLGRIGNGLLYHPDGVQAFPDGRVWVADTSHHRVVVLDAGGRLQETLGRRGTGPGELTWPRGIASTPDGKLVVTDWGNDRVQVFFGGKAYSWGSFSTQNALTNLVAFSAAPGPNGSLLVGSATVHPNASVATTFGQCRIEPPAYGGCGFPGVMDAVRAGSLVATLEQEADSISKYAFLRLYRADGEPISNYRLPAPVPTRPRDWLGLPEVPYRPQLAYQNGRLWIADPLGNAVRECDLRGHVLRTIGSKQLSSPSGIAAAPNGDLYVADTRHHRVVVFDRTGAPRNTFGGPGWGSANLLFPTSLSLARDGGLYVLDRGNRQVKHFSRRGRLLTVSEPLGEGNVWGLAVADDGRVYVAGQHLRMLISRSAERGRNKRSPHPS